MNNARKWNPAEANRARDCENDFQAGGPRVYLFDSFGRRRAIHNSSEFATRHMLPDEIVCARRKVGSQYEWLCATRP